MNKNRLKDYIIVNKWFFIVIPLILLITRLDYEFFTTSVTSYGAVFDDAYITFRFAKNLAEGHVLEYNLGEHSTGTSTLLWCAILALFYMITSFLFPNYFTAFVFISKFISVLSLFFTALGIYFLSNKYYFKNKLLSLFICVFVCFEPHLFLISLSGMEVCFFSALIIWTIIAFREGSYKISAVLGGLCGLTRPEGIIIFPALVLFSLFNDRKKLSFSLVKPFLLNLVIMILIISPWFILNLVFSGKPLPNTFYMKGGSFNFLNLFSGVPFIFQTLSTLDSGYWLPFIFFIGLIIYFMLRKAFSIEGFIALFFVFIYGVLLPNLSGFGRYFLPVLPLIILVSFYAFKLPSIFPLSKPIRQVLPLILIIIPLIIVFQQYASFKNLYAHAVYSTNEIEVNIAYWLVNNTNSRDIIASPDIGAYSFVANRYIVDTFGLINPEIKSWNGTMLEYLHYRNVSYFIDYPYYFKQDISSNCNITHRSVYLSQVSITAGPEVVVYKCSWA